MKSFHSFRLDCVNHCLWRGEDRLSLAPKAFDVLRYLVEHADRLVTQEEILEALWPETFVNPEVIKKYVLGIRRALGDRTDKPAFIATFPRRGYQFIAPVRDEAAAMLSQTQDLGCTIVGRSGALGDLQQAFGKAVRGQRQIVFITGEAGIGKTTLTDAFLQRVAFGATVRIARGQCVEGFGGKEAYYPVFEALGNLLHDSEDELIARTFLKRAPTWLVQFPSLLKPEQRSALEKEIIGSTRDRMVREICEALEAITAQNPLLLCLEDLHWVDPSTLDFISALARRRGPAKLLVLGTYRPADAIILQSPLRALKQDLVLHSLAQEIGLERLEPADTSEYLAAKFPDAGFPDEFASVVHGHSGGNALFMVTILQDMQKKGLVQNVDGRWMLNAPIRDVVRGVPETLDQLIESQFRQLSELEQGILRSASVAGERFSVWAISAAAETDVVEVETVCAGLADKLQFIKAAGLHELANGQISAHYEFVHSLYREVLYRRLSEATRSKLHMLLAKRLQAFCDPCEQEMATELALHFEGGHEHEQAVRYLILAAENAARRFAYRDAIEILEHALEVLGKVVASRRGDLGARIYEYIGDAHFALGAIPQSAEAYRASAQQAQEAGLKAAEVHALICAMYPLGFINADEGIAAMDEAVKLSAGDPELSAGAEMLAASCRLVFDGWSHKVAVACESAQQRLLACSGSPCNPYQQMAYAHFLTLRGDYREALDIFEPGMSRSDHCITLIPHFGALSGKTIALLRMGQLGEVLRITRNAEELGDDNQARAWLLSFREAWVRILAYDYEGAYRICDGIVRASAKYHPGQPQTIRDVASGYLEFERGDYTSAMQHFARVAEPEVSTKFFLHWTWRLTAQLETANAWLKSGELARARKAADDALEACLSTADPYLRALAWELKARVAVAENDLSGARQAIQRALGIVEKFQILIAAWQTYATASELYEGSDGIAEKYRDRAESCILRIANSFAADEPLRASFLRAAPIAKFLGATQAAHV